MRKIVIVLALAILPCMAGFAGQNGTSRALRIGISYIPPYILSENGSLSGVCIDLWKIIGDSLDLDYQYIYYKDTDSILCDLKQGTIDLSICPMTITNDRLGKYDYTIPFYISNLGIATRIDKGSPLISMMNNLLSWYILRWLIYILIIAAVFAVFMWFAERRVNAGQFRPGLPGLLDGVWWAFVTMTTVGYGDKIPKTALGKVLAILWMFFAIALFFVAAGVVSSQLTVSTLHSDIKNINDLSSCRVGSLYRSGYEETLNRNHIKHKVFPTMMEGMQAVEVDLIDAFVGDETIMKYMVSKFFRPGTIAVFPSTLNLQYFCFMISKEKAGLAERINPVLLKTIDEVAWQEILDRYDIR
jgi:ABC-type amino acid transport substrate-binding protein